MVELTLDLKGFQMPRGVYEREPLEDRLLNGIKINAETGCWEWTLSKDRYGYGRIQMGRKNKTAHRTSFELHRGPVPDGLCICHHCDVRSCVNPDHLFLGTTSENNADMVAKGRQTKGALRKTAKLSDAEALAILAETGKIRDIAKKYGIGKSQVWNIRAGKKWAHLPRPPNTSNLL